MSGTHSHLSHLYCPKSGEHYDSDRIQQLSRAGSPLLAAYDLETLKRTWRPSDLAGREATLWRYRELLPIRDPANVVSLGEGFTPLLPLPRLGRELGIADLYLVDGLISDAGKIVAQAVADGGLYDASTLKEPYRIEGKKTMGLELAEQFGWQLPDVILYPTGGGVGLIGIHKAFKELRELGWIDPARPLPRLVAVQASGCAPIVKAWQARATASEFWPDSHTIAFGINVPKALGDFLVLEALYESEGCAIAVDDAELLAEQRRAAELEGAFVCPEGAALFAAARRLRGNGWIRDGERVVALNTGAGIKYPDTFHADAPLLQPGDRLSVA